MKPLYDQQVMDQLWMQTGQLQVSSDGCQDSRGSTIERNLQGIKYRNTRIQANGMDYESKSIPQNTVLETQHTQKKFPDDLFMLLLRRLSLIGFINKRLGAGVGIRIYTDFPGHTPLPSRPCFQTQRHNLLYPWTSAQSFSMVHIRVVTQQVRKVDV